MSGSESSPTSNDSEVLFGDLDGVCTVTLNRPASLNAVTRPGMELLLEVLLRAADDPSVRVIAMTGAGRAFCAGADLRANGDERGAMPVIQRIVRVITDAPKPVIALVNGVAAGVGISLMMACDLALAAESASLRQAFNAIGLMPDGGGTALLAATVGRGRAMRISLLGDRIDAPEALELGLFARTWSDERFVDESRLLLEQLAKGATAGLGATKTAINLATLQGLGTAFEVEQRGQRILAGTEDFKEGVAAFRERRPPRFAGR